MSSAHCVSVSASASVVHCVRESYNNNVRMVKAVACTENWSFILLEDGQVYYWLDPFMADLADGLIGEKIKQIECGYSHCLALTDSGRIFSWDFNSYEELGILVDTNNHWSPTLSACQFRKAVQNGLPRKPSEKSDYDNYICIS